MIEEKERADGFKYKLPQTLKQALIELKNDKSFVNNLDEYFVKRYIMTKNLENQEMDDMKKKSIKPLAYSLL